MWHSDIWNALQKLLQISKLNNKIKNVYWLIAAKMTTSTQFPTKDVLTPHKYKRTLRAHLKSNWSQIFTKCHKGVKFSSNSNFEIIGLSIYWWIHQTRQKTPQSAKKLGNYWVNGCMRSITCWGYPLKANS